MELTDRSNLIEVSFNKVQKPLIEAEFSKNAVLYDSVAVVQRRIANRVVTEALIALQNRDDYERCYILDAGCGTGYVGERLLEQFCHQASANISAEIDLMALDLSHEMLAIAKKREVYTAFTQGDIEALPFSDEAFDLVISSLAIQWCHYPAKAIAELARVARNNHHSSKLIISTLLEGTLYELSAAFRTIDQEQHILDFMNEAGLREIVQQYNGTLTVYEEVVTFPSLKALFLSLKNIGATALPQRRKGLLGRESYQRLDQYFKDLGRYQLTYVVGLIEIP